MLLSRQGNWVVGGFRLLTVALLLFAARGAEGACSGQSPAGCSANRLNIAMQATPLTAPNGTIVTYLVEVTNNSGANADACDVPNAFVTFCCPAANGLPEPGPSGCTKIPVTQPTCNVNDGANCTPTAEALAGISLPANGSNDKSVPGLKCLINVNPGVTTARAQAMVDDGYLLCQLPSPSTGVAQPALAKLLDVIITAEQHPGAPAVGTWTLNLLGVILLALGVRRLRRQGEVRSRH